MAQARTHPAGNRAPGGAAIVARVIFAKPDILLEPTRKGRPENPIPTLARGVATAEPVPTALLRLVRHCYRLLRFMSASSLSTRWPCLLGLPRAAQGVANGSRADCSTGSAGCWHSSSVLQSCRMCAKRCRCWTRCCRKSSATRPAYGSWSVRQRSISRTSRTASRRTGWSAPGGKTNERHGSALQPGSGRRDHRELWR